MENDLNSPEVKEPSCDPALTRKEFITKVVKGVAITGGILTAPKVLDKFIIPAYAAGLSSCNTADTGGSFKDIASMASSPEVVSTLTHDSICQAGGG